MFGQIFCPSHSGEPVRFFSTSAATWSQWGFLPTRRVTLNVTTLWRPTLIFLAAASVYKPAVAFSSSWSSVVFITTNPVSRLQPLSNQRILTAHVHWHVETLQIGGFQDGDLQGFTHCKFIPGYHLDDRSPQAYLLSGRTGWRLEECCVVRTDRWRILKRRRVFGNIVWLSGILKWIKSPKLREMSINLF